MRSFSILLFTIIFISISDKTIECLKKRGTKKTAQEPLKEYDILLSQNSTGTNKLSDATNSENYAGKRWQVERVSRKQYEIINMLWKKTKIFIEVDSTPVLSSATKASSIMNQQQHGKVSQMPFRDIFHLLQPRLNLQSSTPSYIEFYYLDEKDQNIQHKDLFSAKKTADISKTHSFNERLFIVPRNPFFALKINDATCPLETTIFATPSQISEKVSIKAEKDTTQSLNFINKVILKKSSLPTSTLPSLINQANEKTASSLRHNDNEMCKTTFESSPLNIKDVEYHNGYKMKRTSKMISFLEKSVYNSQNTIANDRIRFFEIYDSDTYTPYIFSYHTEYSTHKNDDTNSKDKLALEQVDKNFGNQYNVNRTRFVKKHAVNYFDEKKDEDLKITKNNYDFINSHTPLTNNQVLNLNPSKLFNSSKPVQWSKFPFMAVYVYEPSQVRCDAAAISPHWLVAAAACLYRHHKDPQVDYRSAFVAYCSENWRHPERIAYVKRSLIHPQFHPRDNVRKHLYNMGAIQVVNSLANTCSGWSSITLISYQFVVDSDGTLAAAIGWGLDRYDTSYSTTDLPKFPLMIYESLIYSKSCPGNFDYRKSKQENEDSVKNVYCLSLPAYSSEDNDAVHGALLLYGGKLIALFLQEERRLWGEQSAQYTSVWRLVPWLLDVAREPEDQDSFSFEI